MSGGEWTGLGLSQACPVPRKQCLKTYINAPEPRYGKSTTTNTEGLNWVFGFQIQGDTTSLRLSLQPLSYSSSSAKEAERGNSKSNQAGLAGTPSKGPRSSWPRNS